MTLPLEGVRVLDLSRLLPGPFASLVLADLGAQVDKIEEVKGGDYLRHMPPLVGDESGMFLAINRNKRSASFDLKKPEARDAFLRVVVGGKYDVVLEQFRPGVLDRLGLGHAALMAASPRLVVCALTGYGQDGPLAQRAGHDLNYLARAGLLGLRGPADRPPQPPGFQLADIGGALWSVIGILAALAERGKTGKGSVVDVAMVEASMGFAAASFGALLAGQVPKRGDDALTGGLCGYGTYETKDAKYMSLGALEPKFFLAFAGGVGLDCDMTALVPGPHQAALKEKVAAIFRSRTQAEWIAFANTTDCCLEPVLEPGALASDEQMKARRLFFDLPSPWGTLTQLRLPVGPRDESRHRAPPKQGEHTDAILREAGFTAAEIASLRAAGAVA